MNIKVGDYVTRNSYNNDTVFKVIKLKDGIVYLKGAEVRLIADAYLDDLEVVDEVIEEDDIDEIEVKEELLERGEYFYLPAKVLHIDGDSEYLSRYDTNKSRIEKTEFDLGELVKKCQEKEIL